MLQPRIWTCAQASKLLLLDPSILSQANTTASVTSCLGALTLTSLHHPLTPYTSTRPASHATQGRANKAAPGPGKRLGAKKTDSQLVVPGNIIFRQRGTHWFPGENCGMGKDHTIFALQKGYVRYYRDPERHKERKYIGVVFEREMGLPRGRGAARRRRLGLEVREMSSTVSTSAITVGADGVGIGEEQGLVAGEDKGLGDGTGKEGANDQDRKGKKKKKKKEKPDLKLSGGYMYREANWQIGRAAEKANVKVPAYKPRDRFLARRSQKRGRGRSGMVRRDL